MAMETQELPRYIRLVVSYISGCIQLALPLSREGDNYNQLVPTSNELVQQAIKR